VPGKLDLLFVVDNSNSMAEEQAMLAGAFPALISALFEPPADPGTGEPLYAAVTDLNVGVVSSDMGVGGYTVRTCEGNDDGVLLHAPSPAVPGCAPTYPSFLHADAASHGPDFALGFSCIATLGTNGCGFEQPLGAMDKALTVNSEPGGPNEGFLRGDAVLGVVIVSDENDCSTEDFSIFDPAAGDDLRLRCVSRVAQLTDVAQFGTALRGLRSDGRFVVGMVIGVPPTLGICNATGDVIAPCLAEPLMREQVDAGSGLVRLVCEAAPSTRATPGVRFVELARDLGDHALVQSICDPQFVSFFQELAQMAQTAR
jgi:hypothetical protein